MAPGDKGPQGGSRAAQPDHESGAAVADFVMVSMLVSFIFVGLMQLGLFLHTRNTLIASAAEGARMGARADASPADGQARARELISEQLSSRYAESVDVGSEIQGGVRVIVVRVSAPAPIIGPFGPSRGLSVTARAFAEAQ
ncbi:MAG TPA: pilus assembly protein [Phycicoccus elongatus]|uniref:TadE family protein n=1 Tax=Phycicoccus TaxID=367298 RepID=UPI00258606E9|nr:MULTISPECIES: TadE family protein [Phycicoccus]HPF76840.1 pilus assembly protein [Phycicoccus elongatus]HPK11289.1 pilus assembly protein [Phycicoccus elongatus]HPQ74736.1 pilus assembly protein [Phycicoccus elongatus]HQF04249.1 pilus assembly protein [Phycicoccus sp.]HRC17345.1 pilus assembly protein [Phycicoccus elongatus]